MSERRRTGFKAFTCIWVWLALSGCTRPLFVTHWSAADRAFVKKKGYGYPSHNKLSVIACFDELCLNKAEWRNKQKKYRFKRFKKEWEYRPGEHRRDEEEVAVAGTKEKEKDDEIKINEVQTFTRIHFASGKTDLDRSSTDELDVLADFLKENDDLKLKILGHTDDVGLEEFNRQLSIGRAKAVAEFLIERGIAEDRIAFEGYGSSRPVAEGNSETARQKNRRVEFMVY